jgi:hypothetical protein
MSLFDLLCSVTTGGERRRRFLTPIGLVLDLLLLVIVGTLLTDRARALAGLAPGALGTSIGALSLAIGLSLGPLLCSKEGCYR